MHAELLAHGHGYAVVSGGAANDALGHRAQLAPRSIEDGYRLRSDALDLDLWRLR
jgi:hypothetical protein